MKMPALKLCILLVFCILLVWGAKRTKEGKCCDGGLKQEGEGGLALVRNEDVKINEASAGSDARLIL